MKTFRYAFLFILILLIAVPACSKGLPKEFAAPDFSLKDVFGGKDITYSEYKGKPVLVYFFASW